METKKRKSKSNIISVEYANLQEKGFGLKDNIFYIPTSTTRKDIEGKEINVPFSKQSQIEGYIHKFKIFAMMHPNLIFKLNINDALTNEEMKNALKCLLNCTNIALPKEYR